MNGELVPMPTLPFWSTIRAVEVALAVEVEMVKRGVASSAAPAIDNFAKGDVVPMPTLPVGPIVARMTAFVPNCREPFASLVAKIVEFAIMPANAVPSGAKVF